MDNNTYSRKLLNFNNERLVVWIINEENILSYKHIITCVAYENAMIKEGSILKGVFGEGFNFESACKDYYEKISGHKLVFNPDSKNRYEMYVL